MDGQEEDSVDTEGSFQGNSGYMLHTTFASLLLMWTQLLSGILTGREAVRTFA